MGKRREESVSVVANKKARVSSSSPKEMDGKILKVMLEAHMEKRFDIKITTVANALNTMERTKSFRERWGHLKKMNFIESVKDKGYRLTSEGLKEAATPEYKEMMKELSIKPKTDKEHHTRIKKYLKKSKSGIIFDLLLEYKRLSRKQLADLVGVNGGSHGFSYSLAELRAAGYVEKDPGTKLFFLSEKCFVEGNENRYRQVDAKKLETEIATGRRLVESRKHGARKDAKNKVKKEVKEEKTKVEQKKVIKEKSTANNVAETDMISKGNKSDAENESVGEKATFDDGTETRMGSKEDEIGAGNERVGEKSTVDDGTEKRMESKEDKIDAGNERVEEKSTVDDVGSKEEKSRDNESKASGSSSEMMDVTNELQLDL